MHWFQVSFCGYGAGVAQHLLDMQQAYVTIRIINAHLPDTMAGGLIRFLANASLVFCRECATVMQLYDALSGPGDHTDWS